MHTSTSSIRFLQTKAGPHGIGATVYKLDNPTNWNRLVRYLKDSKEWWGYGRANFSKSGLANAHISLDDSHRRINPEVAVVTRNGKTIEEMLAMTMEELMEELVAFVPYSVLPGKNGYELILPMGLQKTPGGFGYFNPLEYKYAKTVEFAYRIGFAQTEKGVRGVLPMLAAAIKARHPKMALLTRFAKGVSSRNPWDNPVIRIWEKCFPPGHFRVGWKHYERIADVAGPELSRIKMYHKNIAKFQMEIKELYDSDGEIDEDDEGKLQRLRKKIEVQNKRMQRVQNKIDSLDSRTERQEIAHDFSQDDNKPDTYNPREGGAVFDQGILTITDQRGAVIFEDTVEDKAPLNRLADPEVHSSLGTLICGWSMESA